MTDEISIADSKCVSLGGEGSEGGKRSWLPGEGTRWERLRVAKLNLHPVAWNWCRFPGGYRTPVTPWGSRSASFIAQYSMPHLISREGLRWEWGSVKARQWLPRMCVWRGHFHLPICKVSGCAPWALGAARLTRAKLN